MKTVEEILAEINRKVANVEDDLKTCPPMGISYHCNISVRAALNELKDDILEGQVDCNHPNGAKGGDCEYCGQFLGPCNHKWKYCRSILSASYDAFICENCKKVVTGDEATLLGMRRHD